MVSPDGQPAVASGRAYLRNALPGLYRENDFAMRFVGAFEEVLDPIVAQLDALPAHFDPVHAPAHVLELMAAWLGVELIEGQDGTELVRRAAELGRLRGTVGGLELALRLSFPDLQLRVEDLGGVHAGPWTPPAEAARSSFVVYCRDEISDEVARAVSRCIDRFKPVHTTYRLRLRRS
jgi:phage tail-like protein